jgi:hypothetical protein
VIGGHHPSFSPPCPVSDSIPLLVSAISMSQLTLPTTVTLTTFNLTPNLPSFDHHSNLTHRCAQLSHRLSYPKHLSELGSKNAACGAINLVCALFKTVSLGFALPMGSNFYLIFDHPVHATLHHYRISSVIDLIGIFAANNNNTFRTGIPAVGQFSFAKAPTFHPRARHPGLL